MTSLSVQLRSTLVGLIKPLHKPSAKLNDLTNNITYEFACQLYQELQSGPPQISQWFLDNIASSTALGNDFVREDKIEQKALKKSVDSFHDQLLNDTKSKIMVAKPTIDIWSKKMKEISPNLYEFLYYLIASKEECENIKINGEEAKALSEIFFALSRYYPHTSLEVTVGSDCIPVAIYNAPNMFKKLSHSFRELASKKLTDLNAKLSLNNIRIAN